MTPESPSYPQPLHEPRTASRIRWGRLLRPLAVVVVLLGGLVLLAPTLAAYVIERYAIPKVAARYNLNLRVAGVKVRFGRVLLRGVVIRDAQAPKSTLDPLAAPVVEVRFNPWAVFRAKAELTEVKLERPLIQIVRGGDEDNLTALLARVRSPSQTAAEPSKRAYLSGPQVLSLVSAELDVHDDAGSLHVRSIDARVEKNGSGEVALSDSTAEIAGGASAKAELVRVRIKTAGRFMPVGLPHVEIAGGALVPWRRLAVTGITGTVSPDAEQPNKAVIALAGGYGGVDHKLWQASGWVLPDGFGGLRSQRGAEAALTVQADRFLLSQLEPILKDTPIIDADRTEVNARMDLRYAQRALDFSGSFHMAGLSVFSARLVAEPVRDLGFDVSAAGRIDLKTRKFRLERASVKWNGVEAQLEAEAEAQPAKAKPVVATADVVAGQGPAPAPATSWRERWRTVSLHLVVPPVDCQALMNSLPPPVVPRIREFKLTGLFQTDIRVAVDFAKLMRLPTPTELSPEEEGEGGGAGLPPPPAAVAPPPPSVETSPARRARRAGGAASPATAAATQKDPKDEPVQISGKVGIDGCRVVKAPDDMNVARLLGSFEHSVPVEVGRELRFTIGPDNTDYVKYEDLSPYLINSIMTTEDHGFLRHRGFIVPEFRSALQSNLERGYFRLGASSITMQMVKNVLLSREKTLSRKLQEMFLTWYIENNLTDDIEMLKAVAKGTAPLQYWQKKLLQPGQRPTSYPGSAVAATPTAAAAPVLTSAAPPAGAPPAVAPPPAPALGPAPSAQPVAPRSPGAVAGAPVNPAVPPPVTAAEAYAPLRDITPIKRRIFEIYFNAIEFGPYLYGIGAATRHYFGKTPKELTPREAVWFSSILPNPKRRYIHYCKGAPDDKWEKYLERILRRVHERGRLTDAEFAAAMQQRLVFDRAETLEEKDCLALIQRMTEPPPIGTALAPGAQPPPDVPWPPAKLPPPPPWAEQRVHRAH